MQKTKPKLSQKAIVAALKTKHEMAMWRVEQLWNNMPQRDYKARKNIVKAAVGLTKIEQEINVLAKLKVKNGVVWE